MFEDQRLLSGLRAGDKDALRRIYEKYIDDLLRVATSLFVQNSVSRGPPSRFFVDFAEAGAFSILPSCQNWDQKHTNKN